MTKKIKTIAHLADIHIRKNPSRNKEYESVFNSLFESLRKKKPDLIVVVGDLLHDYIDMQSETILLASKFLRSLTDIADVIITQGNHDKILKGGDNRIDAIEAIVGALAIPNLTYLNKTEFYDIKNITFAVWHHADKKSPYELFPEYSPNENTLIDLFHDPINESSNYLGYVFKDKNKRNISEFKGEFGFFGDIHKRQFLADNKAYCGSLIQQDFGEMPENHGYLLWDIEEKTCEEVDIENDYVYETLIIKEKFNYDKMKFNVLYPKAKYLNIKVIWDDLSFNRTQEREMQIKEFLTKKYKPSSIKIEKKAKISNKKKSDKVDSDTIDVNNIEYVNKRYTTYLKEQGYTEDIISKVLTLEETITNRLINKKLIDKKDFELTSLVLDNFQQYGDDVLIDFEGKLGLTQIIGKNQVGKSSIFDAICFALYGRTLGTLTKEKNGDRRYVNNKRDRKDCSVTLSVRVNGVLHNIKRMVNLVDDKVTNSLIVDSNEGDVFINGKSKTETQTNLENLFGGFEEFILLHLTNGSNLEKILSVDRSEFLDSLAKNLGLGVFELKVNEFKDWRVEAKKDNYVSLNPDKEKKLISDLELTNAGLNQLYKTDNDKLTYLSNEIKKTTKLKEEYLSKLTNFNSLVTYDKSSLDSQKQELETKIKENEDDLISLKKEVKKLSVSYDKDKLSSLKTELNTGNEFHYKCKKDELVIKERMIELESKTNFKKMEIDNLNKSLEEARAKYKAVNEAKNCTLCGEVLKGEHLSHIEASKLVIKENGVAIGKKISINENDIKEVNLAISSCEKEISDIEKEITKRVQLEEQLLTEIALIEREKESFELREKLISDGKQKRSETDLLLLELENNKTKLSDYNKNEIAILENKKLNSLISEVEKELNAKINDVDLLRTQISETHIAIIKNNEAIYQKQILITKYFEIKTNEEIERIYLKMIHREGLPFEILKEFIPIINDFLETLLSDVNFNIFFDENIKLKIKKENGSVQDVLQGSGMEKSFISFILKIAMIQTNNNNRFDFIMLDEVMDKLDADNLEHFIQVLNKTKEWVSKIFIINHLHNIYPDYIIEPYIDEAGLTNIFNK